METKTGIIGPKIEHIAILLQTVLVILNTAPSKSGLKIPSVGYNGPSK